MEKDFWQARYETNDTRFDLGAPSRALVDWLDRTVPDGPPPGTTAFVPGCGRGHDVLELARRGYLATGLDFAPNAIRDARAAADSRGLSARARFVEQDLFGLDAAWDASIDLWFEQTCYCAIEPGRRDAYAAVAARCIRAGGTLVFVVYPVDGRAGGPPFAIDPQEVAPRFAPAFELVVLETPLRTSSPSREGKEMFAVLRRETP